MGEGAAHVQLGAVGATDCQSGTVGALSVAPTVLPTRRVAGSGAANLLGQGAKSPEGRRIAGSLPEILRALHAPKPVSE